MFRGYYPEDVEERCAALFHHQHLERGLSMLLNDVRMGNASQAELEKALLAAQTHVTGLARTLSTWISPRYYNERRSDSSTAAQRTFDIVELFEMILDNVDIQDVLSMAQVSRSMKNSIEASTLLQTKLSLRPASADNHIQTPFACTLYRTGGFRCVIDDYRKSWYPQNSSSSTSDATFDLRAYFFPFPGQHLPRIGSTYRRMFVCQPPINEMSVYMFCCPKDERSCFHPQSEVCTVYSAKGLTIGDLYDCAEKLMNEHRWCPNAYTSWLEDNGAVKTDVQFKASIVLQPDDPVLINRVADDEAITADRQERAAKSAKLRAYGQAKTQAHSRGDPIPTFYDFEAANAGVDWLADANSQSLSYYTPGPMPPPPPPHGFPYGFPTVPSLPSPLPAPLVPMPQLPQAAMPPPPSLSLSDDALDSFDFDSFLSNP